MRQIQYALRTRAPVVIFVQAQNVTPRLACVKPAASVHPEPGSNSSSLNFKYYLNLTTKRNYNSKWFTLIIIVLLKNNTRCQSICQ